MAMLTCFAQISGSRILLYGSMGLFLALCVIASRLEMDLPFLLFFLPWSPLIKLYSGSISFYTIALFLFCVIAFAKTGFRLKRYQIYLTAALLVTTLIGKLLQRNGFINSYFVFFLMLFLFPCVTRGSVGKSSFYILTVFFSLGIVTAALTAQQVATLPNISKYITVQSYLRITRLSGFFGDPNFYSAHITAALAGVQLLLIREQKKSRQLLLIVLGVALIYCGLLSASKMFVTVFALLFLVWIPLILRQSGKTSNKIGLILGFLCAGAVVLSSVAFQELFKILDNRFSYASNLSQLTTGRTDLWIKYMKEILFDPLLLLFGEGYSNVVIGTKSSHNTVIQMVFQFGLIGSVLLIAWMAKTQRGAFSRPLSLKRKYGIALLLLIGCVIPWFSLDILFFDEFFLLPVYAAVGIEQSAETAPSPVLRANETPFKINRSVLI